MTYKVDDIVSGVVTNVTDYGIFVKLKDNYSGLIHISEITNGYVKNVEDFATTGDVIVSKITALNEEKKQISLTLKNDITDLERGSGFKILKDNLDKWIDEELSKEKK